MKKLLTIGILMVLSGCSAPGDEQYCGHFGVTKQNAQYPACKAYYMKMEQWFQGDLNVCNTKASMAYPDYLYDHPRYAQTQYVDHFGMMRTANTLVEPDYARNLSLDSERNKIISPCMAAKGWNSFTTWQAGRIGEKSQPFH